MNIRQIQPPHNGGIVPPWLQPPVLHPDTPRIWKRETDGYEQVIGKDVAGWIAQQRREIAYTIRRRELADG
jgi:hypothetical protein